MQRRRRSYVCARASENESARAGSVSETQAASVIAGLGTRLALHPVDSVKTRLQRLRGRRGMFGGVGALRQQIRAEGLRSLYRGLLGALCGVLPYSMRTCPVLSAAGRARTQTDEIMHRSD